MEDESASEGKGYIAKCKKMGYDPDNIISKAVLGKDTKAQTEARQRIIIYTSSKRGKDD